MANNTHELDTLTKRITQLKEKKDKAKKRVFEPI